MNQMEESLMLLMVWCWMEKPSCNKRLGVKSWRKIAFSRVLSGRQQSLFRNREGSLHFAPAMDLRMVCWLWKQRILIEGKWRFPGLILNRKNFDECGGKSSVPFGWFFLRGEGFHCFAFDSIQWWEWIGFSFSEPLWIEEKAVDETPRSDLNLTKERY